MRNATTEAPQPDLRSFIMYDEVPPGCIAHPVMDMEGWPHIRPGECAIVDVNDREPVHGDLFVITYTSGVDGPVRRVVKAISHPIRSHPNPPRQGWMAAGLRRQRPISLTGAPIDDLPPIRWGDGPYMTDHLTEKLVGRIVGILVPKFEEPRRLSGAR